MRRRSGALFLLFGLGLAIVVAAAVLRLANQAQAARVELMEMLVATQDVPERTLLTPAMVTVRQTPPDAMPAGALVRPDQATGRMTRAPLFAGDPIVSAKLAETNGRSGLTFAIEPGQVVITMPSSDIITTGAVRAGDRVDVLITLLPESKTGAGRDDTRTTELPATTQLMLQNLRIIGIGNVAPNTGPGPGKSEGGTQSPAAQLFTFAVSHQDALILKALKDSGRVKLEFALRAAGDDRIVETEPVTIERLVERFGLRAR